MKNVMKKLVKSRLFAIVLAIVLIASVATVAMAAEEDPADTKLACMVFHLFVNFMQEKIAMTPETKCVETLVVIAATAIIVLAKKDMFFETRHVGRLLETLTEK